jgi:hypothetical protein
LRYRKFGANQGDPERRPNGPVQQRFAQINLEPDFIQFDHGIASVSDFYILEDQAR